MDKLLMSMTYDDCMKKTYIILKRDNISFAINSFIKRLLIIKNRIVIWLCEAFVLYILLIVLMFLFIQ